MSSVLIDLTNTARVTSNLPILTPNQQLTLAATLKGEDMLEKQYFSHNAPDGTLPWHWLTVAGYKFIYAGENLGINFTSSSKLEKAWLSSPKHRDNILNKNYEDVGIATVRGGTTDHPVVFIVQLFGKSTDTDRINKNLSTSPFYTIISSSASLYQKLIFNTSYYIEMLYFFLIILIGASLCIMIFIEISVQHYVHIFYGLLLCIVIAICIAINSFFV